MVEINFPQICVGCGTQENLLDTRINYSSTTEETYGTKKYKYKTTITGDAKICPDCKTFARKKAVIYATIGIPSLIVLGILTGAFYGTNLKIPVFIFIVSACATCGLGGYFSWRTYGNLRFPIREFFDILVKWGNGGSYDLEFFVNNPTYREAFSKANPTYKVNPKYREK